MIFIWKLNIIADELRIFQKATVSHLNIYTYENVVIFISLLNYIKSFYSFHKKLDKKDR